MSINWLVILNKFLDGVVFGTGFFAAFSIWAVWIFKTKDKKKKDEVKS